MGQSAPTTGEAFDAFEARYRDFRAHLGRLEQAWFDEIVCIGRRHNQALNRYPHLDFERPLLLAVLLDIMRQGDTVGADLHQEIQNARRRLVDAGLLPRTPIDPFVSRRGQMRLPDF